MREHEGVETRPGTGDPLEEARPFVHPPAGEHDVRERVLRPRFLALESERRTRRLLGLGQQVTLLVGERRHAVRVGNVRILAEHLDDGAKHGGRIAPVELEVLQQLDHHQIAGESIRGDAGKTDRFRQVARDPCTKHRGVQLLALRGSGRRTLSRCLIFGGTLGGIGRLEQHPQETGVDIGDAAIRIRIGGSDDTLRPGLVRQEPLDEVVDRLRGI